MTGRPPSLFPALLDSTSSHRALFCGGACRRRLQRLLLLPETRVNVIILELA